MLEVSIKSNTIKCFWKFKDATDIISVVAENTHSRFVSFWTFFSQRSYSLVLVILVDSPWTDSCMVVFILIGCIQWVNGTSKNCFAIYNSCACLIKPLWTGDLTMCIRPFLQDFLVILKHLLQKLLENLD